MQKQPLRARYGFIFSDGYSRWTLIALVLATFLIAPGVFAGPGSVWTVESTYGTPLWTPTAAYDYQNGRYLVAYTDNDGPGNSTCTYANSCRANVTARLFSEDGTFIRQAILANTGYEAQKDPHVAYNRSLEEYFVVYYDNTRGDVQNQCQYNSEIYGVRVDKNGYVIPNSHVNLSGTAYQDWHNVRPRVSWNPVNSQYLVAWQTATMSSVCQHGIGGADWRIRARRVTSAGSPTGSIFSPSVDSSARGERPDVQVSYWTGDYLVAWKDSRMGSGQDTHIIGAMLLKNGARKFSWDLLIGSSELHDDGPKLEYNYHSDEWLATWFSIEDSNGGDIWAQRLRGSDANWVGDPKKVYNGTSVRRGGWPAVEHCGSSDKIYFAYERSDGRVDYKQLSSDLSTEQSSGIITTSGKAAAFADDHCVWNTGKGLVLWESRESNVVQTSPEIKDSNIYARNLD